MKYVVVIHFPGNTINFQELPKFHTVLGNISISLYFANPDSNHKKKSVFYHLGDFGNITLTQI